MKPAKGIFCCCGELDCLQVVWQVLSEGEWELGGALGGWAGIATSCKLL